MGSSLDSLGRRDMLPMTDPSIDLSDNENIIPDMRVQLWSTFYGQHELGRVLEI